MVGYLVSTSVLEQECTLRHAKGTSVAQFFAKFSIAQISLHILGSD